MPLCWVKSHASSASCNRIHQRMWHGVVTASPYRTTPSMLLSTVTVSVVWPYHRHIQVNIYTYTLLWLRYKIFITFIPSTDDAGVYACTATNPLGTATTSGQLLVQAKRLWIDYKAVNWEKNSTKSTAENVWELSLNIINTEYTKVLRTFRYTLSS